MHNVMRSCNTNDNLGQDFLTRTGKSNNKCDTDPYDKLIQKLTTLVKDIGQIATQTEPLYGCSDQKVVFLRTH